MSGSRESWKGDEEEDEEEVDETNYVDHKDAVLFAIDVSKTMLADPPPSNDKKPVYSPTIAALKCAYEIMQQRIISSPKDMMGVLLFGTKNSKFQDEENSRGALSYRNCYLLTKLDVPSAEDVKTLREVVEGDEEYKDLLIPSEEPVSMTSLFFCANQIFTTGAPNFGSRRLFIITDQDSPHGSDKKAKENAATRAYDLNDLGIVIELFPISHPGHDFDRTKFYDDIVYRDPGEEKENRVAQTDFKSSGDDGILLLDALISDINSKQVAKRALFSNLPFEIGPNFVVSVKGYNLLQPQKPARNHWVWTKGEKPQLAIGVPGHVAETNAVQKSDIRKAYKFGGSQVLFSPGEMKELKNFGPPVLRVIGFKPQSLLPVWASVKKSTFIYPTEEHYVGSTRVFAAFWKKLLKDKIMGLAWYIARSNSTPIIVAILPSKERLDEPTKIPAGLWLYPIPFADDLRQLGPVPKPIIASDALVDKMITIVKQLGLPKGRYDPKNYPNPSLQWFYKVLQAMALGDTVPDKVDDKTMPKFRQINKRAGEDIHRWGAQLEDEAELYKHVQSSKRGSEEPEGPKKKRVKTESSSSKPLENLSTAELKRLVGSDSLGKCTVVQLKDLLTAKGLSASGRKQDLIQRIEEWVEES